MKEGPLHSIHLCPCSYSLALRSVEFMYTFSFLFVCVCVCGSLTVYYSADAAERDAGPEMFYLLSELASIKLMDPFNSLFPLSAASLRNTLKRS